MAKQNVLNIYLMGIVQPDRISVKINNVNNYAIHYIFLLNKDLIVGQRLLGELEIMSNITVGSIVLTADNIKGSVEKIEKEMVYINQVAYNILSVTPLDIPTVIFVPF